MEIQNYKSDLPHSPKFSIQVLTGFDTRKLVSSSEKGWDPSPGVWCSRSLEHLTLIQWRHCWPPERACWSSPTSCLALFVFLPSSRLLFLLTRQHGIQEIRVLQTPKTLTLILWMATQQPTTTGRVEATYLPTYLKSEDRPFYYLKPCQIMMTS